MNERYKLSRRGPRRLSAGFSRIGWPGLISFLGAVSLALSGCSTVPSTSDADDAEAKRFTSLPDQAVVYVVLDSRSVGVNLRVDKGSVGSLVPKSFVMLNLSPGRHVFCAEYNNLADVERALIVDPGKIYYVAAGVSGFTGSNPACFLKPISEQEGRALVLKSKRATAMTGSAQSVLGR